MFRVIYHYVKTYICLSYTGVTTLNLVNNQLTELTESVFKPMMDQESNFRLWSEGKLSLCILYRWDGKCFATHIKYCTVIYIHTNSNLLFRNQHRVDINKAKCCTVHTWHFPRLYCLINKAYSSRYISIYNVVGRMYGS